MPRLPIIEPATATGRAKELYEGPLKGKHLNIFKGMMNAPAAVEAYLGIGAALKSASLTAKEQEIVQLAVVEANGCQYCASAHTAIGKGAGLTDEQIIGARRGSVEGDKRLNALAKFASAVYEKRGLVSDAELKSFREAGFTDQAIAEVVAVYTQAILTSTFNHLNDTAVDFPLAPAIK
jgi:uncharacterized peroxidase-related enzyme